MSFVSPFLARNKILFIAVAMSVSLSSANSSCWAAKVDPTLSYIAADEPIHQPGFPPLPDRIDVQNSNASWASLPASRPALPGQKSIVEPPPRYFVKDQERSVNRNRATRQLNKEPELDPHQDQVNTTEAPLPVAITQSKTQDLSLSDDEFDPNNKIKKAPSALGNTLNSVKQQMLTPFRQAGSMGAGAINRGIRF